MPPKLQVDESFAFLFMCIEASGCKIDFKAVGDATELQPAAARMRYTRLKKAVESGLFRGATLNQPQPTSPQLAALANPQSRRNGTAAHANRVRREKYIMTGQDATQFDEARRPQRLYTLDSSSDADDDKEEEDEEEEERQSPVRRQRKRKVRPVTPNNDSQALFFTDTSETSRINKQIKRNESDESVQELEEAGNGNAGGHNTDNALVLWSRPGIESVNSRSSRTRRQLPTSDNQGDDDLVGNVSRKGRNSFDQYNTGFVGSYQALNHTQQPARRLLKNVAKPKPDRNSVGAVAEAHRDLRHNAPQPGQRTASPSMPPNMLAYNTSTACDNQNAAYDSAPSTANRRPSQTSTNVSSTNSITRPTPHGFHHTSVFDNFQGILAHPYSSAAARPKSTTSIPSIEALRARNAAALSKSRSNNSTSEHQLGSPSPRRNRVRQHSKPEEEIEDEEENAIQRVMATLEQGSRDATMEAAETLGALAQSSPARVELVDEAGDHST